MSDFREEMFEVRAWNENYYEDQVTVYSNLDWAVDAAAELRKDGFETEIYKLTVFEEALG
jgi:hypothetical protein